MEDQIEPMGIQSKEVAESQIRALNSTVWQRYLEGKFIEAAQQANNLFSIAVERQVDPELQAEILSTSAWAEYYVAQDTKRKREVPSKDSYLSAKQGIELSQDPRIRSRLFEAAGLSQAYIFDEQDEPAEPLFRQSIEEAERSQVNARIGEAKNGFALWFISPGQRRFEEAIPLFQEVTQIHEEELQRDNIQEQERSSLHRVAGHGYNNLILCFNSTGRFEEAVESANKAIEHYRQHNNDPHLNHAFSARHRKSLAWRGLGEQTGNELYFRQAIGIYQMHRELRVEEGRLDLAENEDRNITATEEEMGHLA